MLGEFWYSGIEVCTMLGEFVQWYGGLYHVRGVLVQWYGGLYHVRRIWYNGMKVCTMVQWEVCTMFGEFWYNGTEFVPC